MRNLLLLSFCGVQFEFCKNINRKDILLQSTSSSERTLSTGLSANFSHPSERMGQHFTQLRASRWSINISVYNKLEATNPCTIFGIISTAIRINRNPSTVQLCELHLSKSRIDGSSIASV